MKISRENLKQIIIGITTSILGSAIWYLITLFGAKIMLYNFLITFFSLLSYSMFILALYNVTSKQKKELLEHGKLGQQGNLEYEKEIERLDAKIKNLKIENQKIYESQLGKDSSNKAKFQDMRSDIDDLKKNK